MNRKINILYVSLIAMFFVNYSILGFKSLGFVKNLSKDEKTPEIISSDNFNKRDNEFLKNNEDLLNVDYKTFYDDLNPYGQWIEVNLSKNIGGSEQKIEKDPLSDALRSLFGIKDAKADFGFAWSLFYVWRPSPNLAISVSAGDPYPVYTPYRNGRWVYSDYGWYFRAATPYEELTHHYGRWVFVVSYGWIWVPGRVWAPAWVSWEEDDDYIAWIPSSPDVYVVSQYYGLPYRMEPQYFVCERRHFLEPEIYKFSGTYKNIEFEKRFHNMKNDGVVTYAGRYDLNRGPDANRLERELRKPIRPVNINTVSRKDKVKYGEKNFSVYAPLKGEKKIRGTNESGRDLRETKNIKNKNERQDFSGNGNKMKRENVKSNKNTFKENGVFDKRDNNKKERSRVTENKKWETGNSFKKEKGNKNRGQNSRIRGDDTKNFKRDAYTPEKQKGNKQKYSTDRRENPTKETNNGISKNNKNSGRSKSGK